MMMDARHLSAYAVMLLGACLLLLVPTERWSPSRSGLVVLGGILLIALLVGRYL